MTNNGYVIWARQTIDSDIFYYRSDKWFKIWFYIVARVNHKEDHLFKRGSALITYDEIMAKTKATKQQVKDCIHHLEKEHMIESQKTTRGMIRFVVNYELYQDVKNYKTTGRPQGRPLEDHQRTPLINKNDNNEKSYVVSEKGDTKSLDEVANILLGFFNKTLRKNYRTTKPFIKNLETWLETYSPLDIARAIKVMPGKKFFGSIGPEILFRKSNTKGEPVDYIGSLLNGAYQKEASGGMINNLLNE